MNHKPSCSHKIPILVSEDTPMDEICDDCVEKIFNFRENLQTIFQNEGRYMLGDELKEGYDMSWEINLLETTPEEAKIPDHLLNYININLKSSDSEAESLIVKIFRKGVQLLRSNLPESEYSLEMVPMSMVRNSIAGESLKLTDHSRNISYQLLGEGETSLYLSIQFENPISSFSELSVRKNGRLIRTQKIDTKTSAGVSGLVEGEYVISLSGQKDSKDLKIQISYE